LEVALNTLDTLIREYVSPALSGPGYQRHGRIFRAMSSVEDVAVIRFAPFRLGKAHWEFFVDTGIVVSTRVRMWADGSVDMRKVTDANAIWADRFGPPDGGFERVWSVDQDPDQIDRFLGLLHETATNLLRLLDRGELKRLVMDPNTPRYQIKSRPPEFAAAMLLADGPPSEELEHLPTKVPSTGEGALLQQRIREYMRSTHQRRVRRRSRPGLPGMG
jgi:hypothetical protein